MSCKSEEGFDVNKLLSIWQKLLKEKEALGIRKTQVDYELTIDVSGENRLIEEMLEA